MTPRLAALRAAKDEAQEAVYPLAVEVQRLRELLTQAQRKLRDAQAAEEKAVLAYLEVSEKEFGR